MAYEQILYGVRDRIATITFNRPERLNAWTPHMGTRALRGVPGGRAPTTTVRVIVVTGAGRGFCAGADMQNLREHPERQPGGRRRDGTDAASGRAPRAHRPDPSGARHAVRLPAEHPEARARRDQRTGRRSRLHPHALLRHPDRVRPRPLHDRVRAPRPHQRARQLVDAAAPGRPGARLRPLLLGPGHRRRRGARDGPRERGRSARRAAAARLRRARPSSRP